VRSGVGPLVLYSDVAGGWAGPGNRDEDPQWARRGVWVDREDPGHVVGPDHVRAVWVQGDYHLRSATGRWDAASQGWVRDGLSSPCIDAGDVSSPVGYEPVPNGGIVNLGVYGGTTQASQSSLAGSDEPVYFADAILELAVEEALGLVDPASMDMLGLESLTPVGVSAIRNLTGLEYALNLQTLNLNNHQICDLSPLSGLTQLGHLNIHENYLTDISVLSGLTNLWFLDLRLNQIRDISALSGLTSLRVLYLTGNPLNSEAYGITIPLIMANNPGILLLADAPD